MKISSITIENFRQYYSNVNIDLNTEDNKNIVLIFAISLESVIHLDQIPFNLKQQPFV